MTVWGLLLVCLTILYGRVHSQQFDEAHVDAYVDSTPGARELFSTEAVEAFLKKDTLRPAVVAYINAKKKPKELEQFKNIAESEEEFIRFAWISSPEVLAAKNYECAVYVFPPATFVSDKEKMKFRFPGSTLIGPTFLEYLKLKSLPVVGELTKTNYRLYETIGKPILTVFANVDSQQHWQGYQYIANRLRKVAAASVSADILFNVAHIEDFLSEIQNDYEFSDFKRSDMLVGLRYNNYRFSMHEKFSVESVVDFLQKFEDGTLKGKLKVVDNTNA